MLRSVKNWLTLVVVALVALAMLVAWAYVIPPLTARLDQQKFTDMTGNVNTISVTVSEFVRYNSARRRTVVTDESALDLNLRLLSTRLNARTVVLTRDLEPCTDTSALKPFRIGKFPMVQEAKETRLTAQGIVRTGGNRYAVMAVPLFAEENEHVYFAAVVLVAAPLGDVDNAVAAVQRSLLRASLLALGLSLALGYLASYFIARRLKRIERSAEMIAAGDLNAAVQVTVEDEIGQLGLTFNIMAARLRDAFAAVEYERDRIEVLLNDLSEGVIGVSADDVITVVNPAASELLGSDLPLGAAVADVLPPDVATTWRDSMADGIGQAIVFEHGDRTLEATAYPVRGEADVMSIVVLRDVSSQARLERARRDLIANASHEFKTPLFSLAGFLELIDEGNLSPEEQREFLQLMRVQVDRLRNLAVSMLDLSRVEAGSIEIRPEHVELETVAQAVLDEFQTQAQAKELGLVAERSGTRLTAWCDEERLAQILRALVDNAVKFSRPGSTVGISVTEEGALAAVTVSDDGPGIPRRELPHVFERFQRGRDERARTAGAGLGLSIARELTDLMGGTISVESPDEGGARFTVRLPRIAPHRATGGDR